MPMTATLSGAVADLMRETEYYLPEGGEFVQIAPKVTIAYEDPDRIRIKHGYWDSVPTPRDAWRDVSRKWEVMRLSNTRILVRRRLSSLTPEEDMILRSYVADRLTTPD